MHSLRDVVVIGCGASGIAALSRLKQAGLDVVGLEAADRIGGRIHTVDFAGGVVDLGAAWCHGETGNKVYELAAPHYLLGSPAPTIDWFICSNGSIIPPGNGQSVVSKFTDTIDKADKNNTTSISECIRNDVRTNPNADPGRIPVTEPFIEWFERENHVGGQDDRRKGKSLKGLVEHKACEGEFWLHWKGRGYKTILDVLLNKPPYSAIPIEPEIQLNKKVNSIRWQLETNDKHKKPYVEVRCSDGTSFDTKAVIVTVSIGVLKESHNQLFSPALPTEKVNTIDNLQFCVLDKIYIEFLTQWWPDSPAYYRILWKEEDKARVSEDQKWITEIYGLRTVEHQPRVLLAWIYGKGAEQMEQKSVEAVTAGVQRLMDLVFSLNFEVSRITSVKRSQWAQNKLVRGAYSYRSVATEEAGVFAADLQTPMSYKGKSVVYFSGEASSATHHNSVHGAIEAGILTANKVMQNIPR